VLNEGAILAARRDKNSIAMAELEEAIDRVGAGPDRKSHAMSAREKELTAYHESGHAVVARGSWRTTIQYTRSPSSRVGCAWAAHDFLPPRIGCT
jgi:hypothetical protein